MARFYFDISEDGETVLDEQGLDLAGLEMAVIEAQRTIAQMAVDDSYSGKLISRSIEIRREDSGHIATAQADMRVKLDDRGD